MPLPVISDVFRVALEWSPSGLISKPATNVMHFKAAGLTESDIYTALDGAVTANMWAHTSTGVGVAHVAVQKLDGSSAGSIFATGAPSKWVGTHSSSDLFPAGAVVAKFGTAKRGRSYRGRAYLPWVCEAAQAFGNVDGTVLTNMNTAWATWLSTMHGGAAVPGVASYKLSTFEPITSVVVEPLLATQRRRQPR